MAGVAQLVRAPGCGSGGRRFDPGHSPHFLIFFVGLVFNSLVAQESKTNELKQLPSPVESIIPASLPLKPNTKKPSITIIIDGFGAREDWSEIITTSFPSKTILSIASHLPLNMECIKTALTFGFNLAISIDYVTRAQWQILQKVILQLNEEIKNINSSASICGVVVWRIAEEEDFSKIMQSMKEWLTANNMWLFYANTSNILPVNILPPGVLTPDVFVLPTDSAQHAEDMANFVFSQARYNGKGIILLKPAKQHFKKLSDWLQNHVDDITLENWQHNK